MEHSTHKRVFISYSHDSPSHMAWVLSLASRLRSDGVDAWIDRYVAAPSEGWPRWMQHQIEESDFIILVCTKVYKARFEGRVLAGEGKGVTWEGLIANQLLYEDASRNHVFIPVLPPYSDVSDIPIILRSFTSYHLETQYDALYRHIVGQPEVLPDPLGENTHTTSPKFGPWLSMREEKEGEAHEENREKRSLEWKPVKSEGLPADPSSINTPVVLSPSGEIFSSVELFSPLSCQVFHSGVICTKYGPESPTWSVQVMDSHKLFKEDGKVKELQPFLVLVESRTKEAITIVSNTKLWIRNPVASGSVVNVRDRIATILIPDQGDTHLSFTISRGATYEGVLKYRPRINDWFWRAVGSSYKRNKYEIVEHHLEQNSGVVHVVAPSAGVFEYAPDFHYQFGHPIRANELLGFIRRGNSSFEVRPNCSGLLLTTMVRNHEAVHAGQQLFRIRAGPPCLHVTMMPAVADLEWYELYSPIGGKFYPSTSATGGESISSGFKFKRGRSLCYIDSGNLQMHIALDIEGTLMQVYPEAGDDVSFGQLLLIVRAKRIFVRAYVVGNFYRALSPGAEPFVEVGDTVSVGQTLCIIEALKLENYIESDCAGIIAEILVENGHPLEYGQPLFIIKVEE